MKVFVFPQFNYLLPSLKSRGIGTAYFEVKRFPNKEFRCLVNADVNGQDCTIIGTLAPPASNLLEISLLSHTLKCSGAKKVTVVLPYLAYSRQDKYQPGQSLGVEWVSRLLSASGIDQIVTIDLHSSEDEKYLKIPVLSISPARLFASEIRELIDRDWSVLAPDKGAIKRAEEFAKSAGLNQHVAHLEKVRASSVYHQKLVGEVGSEVVIIDDILGTGSTLISACQILKKNNTKEIVIAVSHGEFVGKKWKELWKLGVKKIYCLDTIPSVTKMKSSRIKIIPCGELLSQNLTDKG